MLGAAAVVGLAPKMFARFVSPRPTAPAAAPVARFTLRPDSRAVARRADSI